DLLYVRPGPGDVGRAPSDAPSPVCGVVQAGQAGVVDLQVPAAERAQAPDLLGVGGGQVRPELLHVRIDLGVDRRRATAVVHHVRRRDRELGRRRRRYRLQVREVVLKNRAIQPDLAADVQRGG